MTATFPKVLTEKVLKPGTVSPISIYVISQAPAVWTLKLKYSEPCALFFFFPLLYILKTFFFLAFNAFSGRGCCDPGAKLGCRAPGSHGHRSGAPGAACAVLWVRCIHPQPAAPVGLCYLLFIKAFPLPSVSTAAALSPKDGFPHRRHVGCLVPQLLSPATTPWR